MPVYMDLIKMFPKMEFTLVYSQEAHAEDEWPIGSKYKVTQHKTLDDRIAAAKMLDEYKYQGKTLIDPIDNRMQETYASWPTRYYLVNKGKIVYIVEPKDATFSFDGIVAKMKQFL